MNDDDASEGPEPFTVPLPPPGDVFFYRAAPPGMGAAGMRGLAGDGPAGRDAEDIMLRRVPSATAMRFRAAAGGRGMTHGQYLAALVALHEAIRGLADGGDAALQAELDKLGLQTVSV